MYHHSAFRLLFAALLAYALASCGASKAVPEAKAAMADFHAKLNDGKFKDIYAATTPAFKAASSEADFVKLLEAVHRKLGKQKSSSEPGWRLNSYNFTTTVVLTTTTEFEQGKGVETFTYLVSKSGCTLQGYNIQSQDLITK
jgi:hypothetical protein